MKYFITFLNTMLVLGSLITLFVGDVALADYLFKVWGIPQAFTVVFCVCLGASVANAVHQWMNDKEQRRNVG